VKRLVTPYTKKPIKKEGPKELTPKGLESQNVAIAFRQLVKFEIIGEKGK